MTLIPFRSGCMDPELMILASTVPVALPWLLTEDGPESIAPASRSPSPCVPLSKEEATAQLFFKSKKNRPSF